MVKNSKLKDLGEAQKTFILTIVKQSNREVGTREGFFLEGALDKNFLKRDL